MLVVVALEEEMSLGCLDVCSLFATIRGAKNKLEVAWGGDRQETPVFSSLGLQSRAGISPSIKKLKPFIFELAC